MVNTILKYLLNVLVFIKKMMNCLEKGEEERERRREKERERESLELAEGCLARAEQEGLCRSEMRRRREECGKKNSNA